MPTVDSQHHDLLFRTAVVGAESRSFVDALPLDGGELHPGEVQGWRPRFTFESFPHDPWSEDASAGADLEKLVPYLDALVLTDALAEGTHYSSTAVEKLSRVLAPGKLRVPTGIYGGPALAQEWETLSGMRPVITVEPQPELAMNVVKALARVLLKSKMRSTPPPPPAGGG